MHVFSFPLHFCVGAEPVAYLFGRNTSDQKPWSWSWIMGKFGEADSDIFSGCRHHRYHQIHPHRYPIESSNTVVVMIKRVYGLGVCRSRARGISMYAVYVCALDPAYYSDAVVHGFCASPADIRALFWPRCVLWYGWEMVHCWNGRFTFLAQIKCPDALYRCARCSHPDHNICSFPLPLPSGRIMQSASIFR